MKTASIFPTLEFLNAEAYAQHYKYTDESLDWDSVQGNSWRSLTTLLGIDIEHQARGKARRAVDMAAADLHGKAAPAASASKPTRLTEDSFKQRAADNPIQAVLQETAKQVNGTKTNSGIMNTSEVAMRIAEALAGLQLEPQKPAEAAIDEETIKRLVANEVSRLFAINTKIIEVKARSGNVVQVGKTHFQFQKILTMVSAGIDPYLVGPAGSGKTHTCKQVADALELDFYALSVCAQSSKTDLLGYQSITTGDYVGTTFRRAYEHGGVFVLDEIDNGNANVLSVLNAALSNGACSFADGMVKRHEDFTLIACANTYGLGADRVYIGRLQLDGATLDRFCMVEFPYDEALELELSPNKKWSNFVQKVRAEFKGERVVISPRASFAGGKLLAAGMDAADVVSVTLKKGLADSLNLRIDAMFKTVGKMD